MADHWVPVRGLLSKSVGLAPGGCAGLLQGSSKHVERGGSGGQCVVSGDTCLLLGFYVDHGRGCVAVGHLFVEVLREHSTLHEQLARGRRGILGYTPSIGVSCQSTCSRP